MVQEIKKIPISQLRMWTENPRDPIAAGASDYEVVMRALSDPKNKWNLDKMQEELGEVYYLNSLPTVVEQDGEFIVFDGNRRIAVLKCLQDDDLYQAATGRLNLDRNNPLASMSEIDCNVCDRDTALDIVARSHAGAKIWGKLEYETFLHRECGEPVGRLMALDRASGGLVGRYARLNTVYVQRRLLSEGSLAPAGLAIVDGRMMSSWPEDMDQELMQAILDVVNGRLSTDRRNPSNLLAALVELDEERFANAPSFDSKQCHEVKPPASEETPEMDMAPSHARPRGVGGARTPVKRRASPSKRSLPDTLFGDALHLSGPSNDHYWALEYVYRGYLKDPDRRRYLLPMLGFGLRLLFESLATTYYSERDDAPKSDNVLKTFLRDVVKPAVRSDDKSLLDQVSITSPWLSGDKDVKAYLSKWAHGDFAPGEDDILSVAQMARAAIQIVFPQ